MSSLDTDRFLPTEQYLVIELACRGFRPDGYLQGGCCNETDRDERTS